MKGKRYIQLAISLVLAITLVAGLIWCVSHLKRSHVQGVPAQTVQPIAQEGKQFLPSRSGDQQSDGTDKTPDQPEDKDDQDQQTDDQQTKETSEQDGDDGDNAGDNRGDAGGDDTNGDGEDTDGDDTDGEPDIPVTPDGPTDDSELTLVTNLQSQTITYNQLTDDTLNFYAYLVNNTNGEYVKINCAAENCDDNGTYLTSSDGQHYAAVLQRNATSIITVYIKDGTDTLQQVEYLIRYEAQAADDENPDIGEDPPQIETALDNIHDVNNRNFDFWVTATAHDGRKLPASNVEVRLDGNVISNPTGSGRLEYAVCFPDPDEGDEERHVITVAAYDNDGNSAYRSYEVIYHFRDTGSEIGTAYVVLDATTVGLDVMEEPFAYRIKQGESASYAVLAMLEANGYRVEYSHTPDDGFYLQRISRGGIMDGYHIPDNLWNKVQQDELSRTGQWDSDSLGEFDFTQGSGWMYTINGQVYEGKGLSSTYLSNGDTLYLRFTLAYGKDIGGYESAGGNYGVLSTYCGKWINGSYIDCHHWGDATMTTEPTCTQPGEMTKTCSVCGDTEVTQTVEPLGHDWEEITTPEDSVVRQCRRCGEISEESVG